MFICKPCNNLNGRLTTLKRGDATLSAGMSEFTGEEMVDFFKTSAHLKGKFLEQGVNAKIQLHREKFSTVAKAGNAPFYPRTYYANTLHFSEEQCDNLEKNNARRWDRGLGCWTFQWEVVSENWEEGEKNSNLMSLRPKEKETEKKTLEQPQDCASTVCGSDLSSLQHIPAEDSSSDADSSDDDSDEAPAMTRKAIKAASAAPSDKPLSKKRLLKAQKKKAKMEKKAKKMAQAAKNKK